MKIIKTFFTALFISYSSLAQITIDAKFAGGNVIVEQIVGDTVYFKPDLRDTEGEWFYWYFRAISNEPKTWFFKATKPNILTNLGAVYATDGGLTWQWMPKEQHLNANLFSFTFTEPDQAVRFALAPPYTQANFEKFITPYQDDERIEISTLGQSNQGRDVEKLLISHFDQPPTSKIVLLARAHACEMMSNYVLEGIVSTLLSGTTKMEKLLAQTELMIIPFLDKDGVENGDQGKNRLPRDHNRDYRGESIYATTKTLREIVPSWTEDLPWVGIDLHNPWVKGEGHEWVYIVGNANPKVEKAQKRFAEILLAEARSSIPLKMQDLFMAYGSSWNTGGNYEKGWPFSKWAASFANENMLMSTTLEFPYALVYDKVVTPEKARAFGKDFIYALAAFMEEQVP